MKSYEASNDCSTLGGRVDCRPDFLDHADDGHKRPSPVSDGPARSLTAGRSQRQQASPGVPLKRRNVPSLCQIGALPVARSQVTSRARPADAWQTDAASGISTVQVSTSSGRQAYHSVRAAAFGMEKARKLSPDRVLAPPSLHRKLAKALFLSKSERED
jgi:hypothetical protein